MEGALLNWSHIASGLGAITVVMLGYLIYSFAEKEKKIDSLSEKFGLLVTHEDCRQNRHDCPTCKKLVEVKVERKEIWTKHEGDTERFRDKFWHHQHTGLPENSVVVTKP